MTRIEFHDVHPDGSLGPDLGTAELVDEQLVYSTDLVRSIMASWVGRFGPAKAFAHFSDWSNGHRVSALT